ncbi:MAG: hypothetical protein ACK53A_16890 [Gemmatimonadota bacterium]|jgi:hypothetical protein|nr:hypothetical protein [Gemmatimonadota bacterium]
MEQLRSSPPALRVFVDGRGADAPLGATALDAVRAAAPALAAAVAAGERRITDSRGLDVSPDTPAHGGAVYRVLKARGTAATAADDEANP